MKFNVLSFDIVRSDVAVVTPRVDGAPLTEAVATFETAQGYDDPAGGYGGLIPAFHHYGPLDAYFLGRGDNPAPGRVYLLGCQCGEVGCWPLTATVEADDQVVRWTDLRQPYRPARDYTAFGPLVFERAAYERALADLMARANRDEA